MARNRGDAVITSRLEPKFSGPLDARCKVDKFSDLINPSTWEDSEGKVWLDSSLIIRVSNDAMNNGSYHLVSDNSDFKLPESWVRFGDCKPSGEDGNEMLTLSVNGVEKESYDGSEATFFDVTVEDLGAVMTPIENPGIISTDTYTFTMYANRDSYKRIVSSLPTLKVVESATTTSLSTGMNFKMFIKNTGTGNMTVTLPTGGNYDNQATSFAIAAGKGGELIITGYGLGRSTTYLENFDIVY